MNKWRETTLGDVAKIKHGFAFKGEFFYGRSNAQYLAHTRKFCHERRFSDGYALTEGDIVVTMTDLSKASDTLGYAAKIPATPGVTYWHNQRIGLLQIRDAQRVYKDWLHYLLRTREYRSWVVGSASGTTVKHTRPKNIRRPCVISTSAVFVPIASKR